MPEKVIHKPSKPTNLQTPVTSENLTEEPYIDHYESASNGNAHEAWGLSYDDRMFEKVPFSNMERRGAEHYLLSKEQVRSSIFSFVPMVICTTRYSAVKMIDYYAIEGINKLRRLEGMPTLPHQVTKPTLGELASGYRGAFDGLPELDSPD